MLYRELEEARLATGNEKITFFEGTTIAAISAFSLFSLFNKHASLPAKMEKFFVSEENSFIGSATG